MNRTDRLLAIVLELQAHGRRRAQDLAETFETSVRTIYRDLDALSESGVPLVAVPGQGYTLVEGYFLPPLRFTPDEASMLLLGADFVAQNLDADYQAAGRSAARKIEAVLAEPTRAEVRELQAGMRFVAFDSATNSGEPGLLPSLRQAILARKSVRFRYQARFSEERETAQTRTVDPYGLAHVSGVWYLIAHDHRRRERRHFRLERMSQLQVLKQMFQRPPDFQLEQSSEEQRRDLVIRALFDSQMARWVRESRFFYMTEAEETKAGLLVTLTVRHEQEVLPWLLGWGEHVRVLEPPSLRTQIARQAQALLEHHA